MKKHLFKAVTLCLSAAVLAACSKDKSLESELNAGNSSPANDPIEQLRTFKKQIESVKANPTSRNTETITLSEALWDIENTFNLTYSDAEQYYGQINNHEFTLSIPVGENDNVNVNDAVNLYSDVIAQAREAFASDEFDEKGFISLTVKETEEDDGVIHVTFSGKTGERCNYNPPIAHVDGPFGTDDNWMFAAPMGKCDDPDIPSGADKQFQEKLYAELIDPFACTSPGFRNIYVNRIRIIYYGYNYSGLYYNTNPDDLCIEYGFMNDYYRGEKTVITQTIPDQYQLWGFTPVSIEINGLFPEGDYCFTHVHEIEYGYRLQVSIDEFGEAQDLMCE